MVCGQPPFRAGSEYLIFQKILALEYDFPDGFDPLAKDLVQRLLVLNPEKRLGAEDAVPYISLREHKFFADIDWNDIGPPPRIGNNIHGSTSTHIGGTIPDHLEPGRQFFLN